VTASALHIHAPLQRGRAFEMICSHTFSERSLTISSTSSSLLADARAAIFLAALFTCRIKEGSNPHYISTHDDVDLNIILLNCSVLLTTVLQVIGLPTNTLRADTVERLTARAGLLMQAMV